jgi:hypothetical protein
VKRLDEVKEEDWIREIEAEDAIQAVWKVLGELSKLDNSQTTEWLKAAETDPYA